MYSELGIWTGQNKPEVTYMYKNLVWKGKVRPYKDFLYPNHLFYSQCISVGSSYY